MSAELALGLGLGLAICLLLFVVLGVYMYLHPPEYEPRKRRGGWSNGATVDAGGSGPSSHGFFAPLTGFLAGIGIGSAFGGGDGDGGDGGGGD